MIVKTVKKRVPTKCAQVPQNTSGRLKTKKIYWGGSTADTDTTPQTQPPRRLTPSALICQIWPAHFWDASAAYGICYRKNRNFRVPFISRISRLRQIRKNNGSRIFNW